MAKRQKEDIFTRFTTKTSEVLGRAWIFALALVLIVIWGATGPLTGYSDTWQLIINTSTTIITFLMVFIIQNTQNRDNLALNIKLDKLLETQGIDDPDVIVAEKKSDKKLERAQRREQKKAGKEPTKGRNK